MNSEDKGSADFGAFVKREQTAFAEDQSVDWAKEREEWLSRLKELYQRIESFLAEYIQAGEIRLSYRDIELNEENIGAYKAEQMMLRIGRQEITLTPVGTLLIGAKGRVEVVGPAGRTRLVLVNSESSGPTIKVSVHIGKTEAPPSETAPKETKWAWKIATSPPIIRYIDLTQESLFQALLEVANG